MLACLHVVEPKGKPLPEVWVGFPRHDPVTWERRAVIGQVARSDAQDAVLLELAEPVPDGVVPAPLRLVPAPDLAGCRWWAFGFPDMAEDGRHASGTFETGAYGSVRLLTEGQPGIDQGFSGTPVWSFDYHAVVGLVTRANLTGLEAGIGQAVTLDAINTGLPRAGLARLGRWQLAAADDDALSEWGWEPPNRSSAHRSWLPVSRAGDTDAHRGYRLRGRNAEIRRITEWLDAPDRSPGILLVTGAGGAGKSTVLGHVIGAADAEVAAAMPTVEDLPRTTIGCVACAVHVSGKTALQVATELARAIAVAIPEVPGDVIGAIQRRWEGRAPSRINLVLDGLDGAASPDQARALVHELIIPLVRRCSDVGIRIIVGTREQDDAGDLVGEFSVATEVLRLDGAGYRADSDLLDYTAGRLRLDGTGTTDSAYADRDTAEHAARWIAEHTDGNFLLAGLVAQARGLHDEKPADLSQLFALPLEPALDAYVTGTPVLDPTNARLALSVLAYAESPGLPLSLWRVGVIALGGRATEDQLFALATTRPTSYLLDVRGSPTAPTYRLFHQVLNELFRDRRKWSPGSAPDEQRLALAWLEYGRAHGWSAAPNYLRGALCGHAQRAGVIDDLLVDDEYLIHADLRRLLPASESAVLPEGLARSRLLQRSAGAVSAGPAERAAMFSLVDTVDQLGTAFAPPLPVAYRGKWASVRTFGERTVLAGHEDAVLGLCQALDMLASVSEDGTLRLWDQITGQQIASRRTSESCLRTVCAVGTVLASAGQDSVIQLWEQHSGQQIGQLIGHTDWVRCLCAVTVGPQQLLASGSDDQTVRLWDPATGDTVRLLDGHPGWVTALCALPTGSGDHLAAAAYGGTIRIWDTARGSLIREVRTETEWVAAMASVRVGDRYLLAVAGYGIAITMWDLVTGAIVSTLGTEDAHVTSLHPFDLGSRSLIAAATEEGSVQVWDPATGAAVERLEGHAGAVHALSHVTVPDRPVLASGGADGTVRLWELGDGRPRTAAGGDPGQVRAICQPPGTAIVAWSSGDGTVRLADADTGQVHQLYPHERPPVTALCSLTTGDGVRIASADRNGTIRLWDVGSNTTATPLDHRMLHGTVLSSVTDSSRSLLAVASEVVIRLWDPLTASVVREIHTAAAATSFTALCPVPGERAALAASDDQGVVRLLAPGTGRQHWAGKGHDGTVTALCLVDGVLASAAADRTIVLWDVVTGRVVHQLSGHAQPVTGLCVARWLGRPVLVSISEDRTARLWDPRTGVPLTSIPLHRHPLCCTALDETLLIGLDTGLLALQLDGRSPEH